LRKFKIIIQEEASQDIRDGAEWYNEQQSGLGKRFKLEVKSQINLLKTSPFFRIRYDNIRCLPLKKFPFMIHFEVDEVKKIVTIRAVFNTSRNPNIWKSRK
jgi:hypothetical protein